MKTIKELSQEAYDVQNACNMLGVSKGFARALDELYSSGVAFSDIATHPVTVLWIDKLMSLARIQFDDGKIHEAYEFIFDQIKLEEQQCLTNPTASQPS